MAAASTLVGVLLIGVVLRDIFQELFEPNAYGRLSHRIKRGVWLVFRWLAKRRPRVLALAGPISVIAIIMAWSVLMTVGWAFVLWPRLPQAFLLSSGLSAAANQGLITALYLSTVTFTTLGYGDITPTGDLFRILLPTEALTGFIILTAAVTWVLSLYPVLDRRRALVHTVSLISRSGLMDGGADDDDADTLESLAMQIITAQGDLNRFPVTYYFRDDREEAALATAMPELLRLADQATHSGTPAVRRRAAMVRNAVEDFAGTLVARGFVDVSPASVGNVLAAYASDHLVPPAGEPSRESAKKPGARKNQGSEN